MSVINLVTKFSPLVDEKFTAEGKTSLITNKDYDFIGTRSIKIYSVGTAPMNDYGRVVTTDANGNPITTRTDTESLNMISRYGAINDLSTSIQEVSMEKDRSFTYAIDKMDEDETLGALNAGASLARQLREVVIPEVDKYTYKKIADNAGKKVQETITKDNAYTSILAGNEYMDEKFVPAEGRVVTVTPAVYNLLKQDKNAVLDTEIGQNMRIRGVIGTMDGVTVQKVPSTFLPEGANFILAHRVATTQAIKLAEYKINTNPQGISGTLVEGRIYYTAFVRNNKKDAIYYSTTAEVEEDPGL